MTQLRFTLHILRHKGRALENAREIANVYFETHNQVTLAWKGDGVTASRQLHSSVISLHPNGVSVTGFERDGDSHHYQEWWLFPQNLTDAAVSGEPYSAAHKADTPREPEASEPVETPGSAPEPDQYRQPEFDKTYEMDPDAKLGSGPPDGDSERVPAKGSQDRWLNWTDALSVGVPELDTDHKVLINIVNEMELATSHLENSEIVSKIVHSLAEYTDYHFSREERVMEAVSYPGLNTHVATHRRLRETLFNYIWGLDQSRNELEIQSFNEFLRDWLIDHIAGADQKYKDAVSVQPERARAAAQSLSYPEFQDTYQAREPAEFGAEKSSDEGRPDLEPDAPVAMEPADNLDAAGAVTDILGREPSQDNGEALSAILAVKGTAAPGMSVEELLGDGDPFAQVTDSEVDDAISDSEDEDNEGIDNMRPAPNDVTEPHDNTAGHQPDDDQDSEKET